MYEVIEHDFIFGTTHAITAFGTKEEAEQHCERCKMGYDHSMFWVEEVKPMPTVHIIPIEPYDDLPF